ncbi:MAG: ribulokinase [Clostridia bacterium]|nr:ribulokinase [Clostridia bacterium]
MKYSIGIDFGTLSARALLVRLSDGAELATSVYDYPHGVITDRIGEHKLPSGFALQHPEDYLEALRFTVPNVLSAAGVSADDVVGLGVDFTSCTVLPIKLDGTPLCLTPEFSDRPHAFVKLWKHHGAQAQADRMTELSLELEPERLSIFGGRISSEWLFPKILETLENDPEVYAAADRFIEAGDWIVLRLTGKESYGACIAGYKATWHKRLGFPKRELLRALNPELESIVGTKLNMNVLPMGSKAGEITPEGARLCGLRPGTAVSVCTIDAHAGAPAAGVTAPGKMMMILGTSAVHLINHPEEKKIEGLCGVVEGASIDGLQTYEAGQCCLGDHFDWFVKNCVPEDYTAAARSEGISIHKYLRNKAIKLRPGESGLIALDFWNGNRSVLVDSQLTGLMLGMDLNTKPEEMYRALIEATAYGTRVIIEAFEDGGIAVNELYAAGGIADKDEMLMQIYSDVTGREIRLSGSPQAGALGSAMYGAVASGYFPDMESCGRVLSKLKDKVYRPIPENVIIYDKLYREYKWLYYLFGRESDSMKRLLAIREQVRKQDRSH